MLAIRLGLVLGGSICCLSQAMAQDAHGERAVAEATSSADDDYNYADIIVTARRRNELLQDVPATINVVSSKDLENYNIRNFSEISNVVAGLSMPSTGVATIRGVSFNQSTSGTSPTIGFYLNDAPVPSADLFRPMFDIGQIELTRGPQGTLRGKAAPSGALTITTKRPNLYDADGYVNATANSLGGINAHGAVGAPIVEGILAVRIAGLVDQGKGDTVESLNNGTNPRSENTGLRGTLVLQPADELELIFTAQKYKSDARSFYQVESLAEQVGLPTVEARDRRAVHDAPNTTHIDNENYNLQARATIGGQLLSYVGQRTVEKVSTIERFDIADRFGPTTLPIFQGIGQYTDRSVRTWSHELRLSSDQRIFDIFDYTIGGFHTTINAPTLLHTPNGVITTGTPVILVGKSLRLKRDEETSFFANITAHLGEKTEISGGVRHINYKTDAGLCSYPSPTAGGFRFTEAFAGPAFETDEPCDLVANFEFHDKWKTWIYSGSIKHEFSSDLMGYATIGTSWRPGIFPGGFQADSLTARQRAFLILDPEKSTSYELGVKSSFLDKKMNLNLASFYQKFTNFPYRPSSAVSYVTPGATRVTTRPGFVAALPVEVYGGELEWSYAPSPRWDMGISAAYTKTKTSGGTAPCNDYLSPSGVADEPGQTYTVDQILDATDGQGIGACLFNQSPAMAPKWSANLRSEYRVPLGMTSDAYLRGLLSWFGKNDPNDPLNPADSVKSYALLNIYAGVRDSSGRWEISAYGKNITNTYRVLSRESGVFTPQFVISGDAPAVPQYRRVLSATSPREFGLNVRYAFGGGR